MSLNWRGVGPRRPQFETQIQHQLFLADMYFAFLGPALDGVPFRMDPWPRLTLVARPEKVDSSVLFIRAWLSDAMNCCGYACSEDFLNPYGQLVDPTLYDSPQVPQQILLKKCPELVECAGAGTPTSPCGCECNLRTEMPELF
jgi:hypothetical protein